MAAISRRKLEQDNHRESHKHGLEIDRSQKNYGRPILPTGFSSFIVAGGNAYTVIQEEIDGIPSEVCIAFDAEEGTTQWKANLDMWRLSNGGGNAGAPDNKGGDGPRSTPAYSDGHIYCYTSDIRLVCLSAEDGSEIWAVEVAKAHGGKNIRWENASAPLIEENLVIVQGGGPEQSFRVSWPSTRKKVP